MREDTRHILLGSVGIILLVVVMVAPSLMISDNTISLGEPASTAKLGSIIPDDVTIEGTITDSYVDVWYTMRFDNTASVTASEINWLFELQEGIRLSNVSIKIGDVTYWGQVMPEQAAIEEYNESVAENESALLVIRSVDGYLVSLNLENGTEATVGVRVEGLLARKLGLYSLDLPISRGIPIETKARIDLTIRSNFDPIAGYSIKGLPSFIATDLTDGIRIEYLSTDTISIENLEIRYTLDRQVGGSQLLTYTNGTDNFFVYLLAPSITEVSDGTHRQYVFILDKSGSMSGTKMEQAKEAFNSMIETLLPTDIFNVVAFDTTISTLWVEPHSASASNIEQAQTWVSNTNAGGSTNFHGAMMTGLDMMTAGENVKAILMLSDGLPTAGEIQTTSGILSAIAGANDLGVSISTVAFGSDSDENLMANIASQNDGFFVFIQPSADAATELVEFYYEFATPIAESYSIEFGEVYDLSALKPLDESPFFNGSEIIVCGRYEASMSVVTTIDYPSGTETYTNTATTASTDKDHIDNIWAQHRITYLLRIAHLEGETPEIRDEIVCLGMEYGIIVEGYTALLITTDGLEETTSTSTDTAATTCTSTYGTAPAATATDAGTGTAPGTYGTGTGGAVPTFDASLSMTVPFAFSFILVTLTAIVVWRRRT